MDEEMTSFKVNSAYKFTKLSPAMKPAGGRWVCAVKRDKQGAVSKFKARWVVQGYPQRDGVDFFKTYAPVSRMATLRMLLLTITANKDFELRQPNLIPSRHPLHLFFP
jgi:hypothetical protein